MRKFFLAALVMFVFSAALSAASDTASLTLVGIVPQEVSLSISELDGAKSLGSSGGAIELLVVEKSNTNLPYSVSISTAGIDEGQAELNETALDASFISVLHNGYLLDIPACASAAWSNGAFGTASNKLGLLQSANIKAPEYIIFTITAI